MFYTLADLREGVRYIADQFQTQRVKNGELDQYINDGKDAAMSLIFPLRENYFTRSKYKDIVSGTRRYQIPEDAKSMIGVDISSDDGSTYSNLRERDIDKRNLTSGTNSVYGFYYDADDIVMLQAPGSNSTNGIRFLIIWDHWDLDDDSDYDNAITACVRASGVVTATMASNALISVGDVIALSSMDDDSFDGAFRVATKVSTTQVTFNQEGKADAAGANTGTLKRRYGLDMPGGRTVKRFVERIALAAILERDEKDSGKNDKQINILSKRIKFNLNKRTRGLTKKIRKRSLYNGLNASPYGRSF